MPYIMITATNAQARGASRAYREKTSHETCKVRAMIRNENACPTHVLILSTKSNSFCMSGNVPRDDYRGDSVIGCRRRSKKHHPVPPDGVFRKHVRCQAFLAAGF